MRRMRFPYMRTHAPDVLATAKAQRWDPAEVIKALILEEVTGRERSALRTRRTAAGFPTGKTFDAWQPTASSIPAPTQHPAHHSGWLAALRVLHQRVWPRKHQRLMSVVVAHEVRRCSVGSPNLDDLGRLVGRTGRPAVHAQPVTYYCTHDNSSPRVLSSSLHPPANRRKREAAPQATVPVPACELRRARSPAVDTRSAGSGSGAGLDERGEDPDARQARDASEPSQPDQDHRLCVAILERRQRLPSHHHLDTRSGIGMRCERVAGRGERPP
jgi:hypothetical protein